FLVAGEAALALRALTAAANDVSFAALPRVDDAIFTVPTKRTAHRAPIYHMPVILRRGDAEGAAAHERWGSFAALRRLRMTSARGRPACSFRSRRRERDR